MKRVLLYLTFFVIAMATGVVLDASGVTIGGKSLFVAISLTASALVLVGNAIIKKTTRGIPFCLLVLLISAIFILKEFTPLDMTTLWVLVPLSLSVALGFAGLVTYKDKLMFLLGTWGIVVSAGLTIGVFYSYLVGGALVIACIIVAIIVKLVKREKKYEIPLISINERAKQLKEMDE